MLLPRAEVVGAAVTVAVVAAVAMMMRAGPMMEEAMMEEAVVEMLLEAVGTVVVAIGAREAAEAAVAVVAALMEMEMEVEVPPEVRLATKSHTPPCCRTLAPASEPRPCPAHTAAPPPELQTPHPSRSGGPRTRHARPPAHTPPPRTPARRSTSEHQRSRAG